MRFPSETFVFKFLRRTVSFSQANSFCFIIAHFQISLQNRQLYPQASQTNDDKQAPRFVDRTFFLPKCNLIFWNMTQAIIEVNWGNESFDATVFLDSLSQ